MTEQLHCNGIVRDSQEIIIGGSFSIRHSFVGLNSEKQQLYNNKYYENKNLHILNDYVLWNILL